MTDITEHILVELSLVQKANKTLYWQNTVRLLDTELQPGVSKSGRQGIWSPRLGPGLFGPRQVSLNLLQS